MRISIIANITTDCFAVINRGFVVAGDVMGSVLRSRMLHHLCAPAEPRLESKPRQAKQALWQATGAVSSLSYLGSSAGRPGTCGTMPCPSGTF